MTTSLGHSHPAAIFWFFLFVAVTLGHHLLGRPAHARAPSTSTRPGAP